MMTNSEIIKNLEERGIVASETTTVKNGVTFNGITIGKKIGVCPVLYRNNDESDKDFLNRLVDISNQDLPQFDIAQLQDPGYALAHATLTVQKRSEEPVIKFSFLNLEAVVRIVVSEDGNGIASFKVRPEMLEAYGFTAEELIDAALQNMRDTFTVRSMAEVLGFPVMTEDPGTLYVATTARMMAGATALLFPSVFRSFCTNLACDECLIIPSSTEELLLTPVGVMDPDDMAAMVHAVNCETVEATLQLDPVIYRYTLATDKIEIAATYGDKFTA